MAILNLKEALDLIDLNVVFPVGGTPTNFGFQIFDGTGWRADVTLRRNDIATDFDLFRDTGSGFEEIVTISDVGRPVVFPVGGPVQSLLNLVLDQNDEIYGSGGADGLAGYKGADFIDGRGGDDILLGGRGRDIITGSRGSDHISGGAGADELLGKVGDDTILGGRGNDFIRGGRGDDDLTGGAGSDTFFFRNGSGNDTITDFELGVDKISFGKGASSMNDLDFFQLGKNVVVVYGADSVRINDATVSAIEDADNFLF